MKRVLVAEDHAAIAATYKLILESESAYEVVVAKNGQECIETYDRFYIGTNTGTNQQGLEGRNVGTGAFDASPIRSASNPFDLVVLDYHMPQKDGIDVAKHGSGAVRHGAGSLKVSTALLLATLRIALFRPADLRKSRDDKSSRGAMTGTHAR